MQKSLEKVDWNKVLFFDIETARGQKTLKKTDEIYSMLEWKFRDKDSGETLPFTKVKDKYLKEGGLHPSMLKIVCISVGYIKDDRIRIKNIVGDEEAIIREFYSIADGRILAGHNIKQFDIPVTRLRAFTHGIKTPTSLNDSGLKPWDISLEPGAKFQIIDTLDILKGTYYYGLSLAECCYMANVPTPKTDINGSQVSECFWKGEIDRIATYCGKDVVASANLIRRVANLEMVELDEEFANIKPPTLAERIYASKDISDDQKQELKELVGKKKLTAKDKKNLYSMLEALIIFTPFMQKGDSPATIKDKELTINNFIKTL